MTSPVPPDRILPDEPVYRPMERFWPYAELSEQPSAEELAHLHPELREVLFGAPLLPFSMSMVFPAFAGEAYGRAVALAKGSDEYTEFVEDGTLRHRARFSPGARPLDLRNLWELIHGVDGTDVLVDDRPVPYARELWLPLVWLLIW
jgi:hypothetical protein